MPARLISPAGLLAAVTLSCAAPTPAAAGGDPGDPAAGLAFAAAQCGACHATGRADASPVEGAPPFRAVAGRWPLDSLAEALAEGIVTGHPAMPETVLGPDQIDDFLAYLDGLARP
ncbi:MAG: c-type cytochrome [Marivibrio sp.]|uniref:c-type cytochrome n=1 Tax=Marivibrio sp. TaxID=2039719 RepID=UPI0032F01038